MPLVCDIFKEGVQKLNENILCGVLLLSLQFGVKLKRSYNIFPVGSVEVGSMKWYRHHSLDIVCLSLYGTMVLVYICWPTFRAEKRN
jgi:hypothetical protein